MLPDRLTLIDDTIRADHAYLERGDRCYFFGEYFAGQSFKGGPTNQLIFNFKCKPTVAAINPARAGYKDRAIKTIAAGLRKAISQRNAEQYTWIPIPPSKAIGEPDYDDRMLRTLHLAFSDYNTDIRSLLRQASSTTPDHEQEERLTPDALRAVLEVDMATLQSAPVRSGIILVDDVLTTGKHFKASEVHLRRVIPNTPIAGVFIARCIHRSPFEEFETNP